MTGPPARQAPQAVPAAARAYARRTYGQDQDTEVIELSEKDATTGVVHPTTARWDAAS